MHVRIAGSPMDAFVTNASPLSGEGRGLLANVIHPADAMLDNVALKDLPGKNGDARRAGSWASTEAACDMLQLNRTIRFCAIG